MRNLMFVASAIGLLAPTAAVSAPDDPGAVLRAAAEQCLHANAPRVTAATQTLTEAVSFLVEDLCVQQISRASQYQVSVKTLATLQANPPKPRFTTSADHPTLGSYEQQQNADAERQAVLVKELKVDPETGELVTPPGFDSTVALRATTGWIFEVVFAQAEFKAVAAESVLAAKESATKR